MAGTAHIIPPFRRREGRRALRSCRGGNGMSGRGVEPQRGQFAAGPFGPQAASRRAASVGPLQRATGREPAPFRGSGSQGSDPPAGGYVGKASRAPLVLRGSRPSGRQLPVRHLVRSDVAKPKHILPTVSGLRARRSAGPSLTFRQQSRTDDDSCPDSRPLPATVRHAPGIAKQTCGKSMT